MGFINKVLLLVKLITSEEVGPTNKNLQRIPMNIIVWALFSCIILNVVYCAPDGNTNANKLQNIKKPSMLQATISMESNRFVRLKLLKSEDIMFFLFENQFNQIKKNTKLYMWRHHLSTLVEHHLVHQNEPCRADDVFQLNQSYIAVDRTKNITFTYNPLTYQFDSYAIPVSPEKIMLHPNLPNIMMVESKKAIYLHNKITKQWFKVANNVIKYIWRNDQTTRVYFIEQNIMTKENKLYVINPFISTIPHQLIPDHQVMTIKELGSDIIALTTHNSETYLQLIDSSEKTRMMYFPRNLIITDFMVELLQDSYLLISVMGQKQFNNVTLFGGDLKTLKFVRLLDNIKTKFKNDEWYCTDLEFHPIMKNMIFANQITTFKETNPTVRTMVSYNLGVRWNVVSVNAVLGENQSYPCSSPKCSFYLYTSCSRQRRYFAMSQRYAPHIILTKGVVTLEDSLTQIFGFFMSTDYGNSFTMIQRGEHDPYMINGGSIIISSQKLSNSVMYSFDGGITFHTLEFSNKNEEIMAVVNYPDISNTKALVFTIHDNDLVMHVMDFKNILDEVCKLRDFVLESPIINGSVNCYKGKRHQNYRKKHDSLCRIDETDPLPLTSSQPCVCRIEDFGCTFGFYLKENECVNDPEHANKVANPGELNNCIPGFFTEIDSHYQKVYEDECIGDVEKKSSLTSICRANAFVNTVIIKLGNTLKLFVTSFDMLNNFYKIELDVPPDEHFHSFFFDFGSSCMYYVVPNLGLKSLCYGNRNALVTLVVIHSPTIYQAAFDFIGNNFIVLDSRGIYLKSKYKKLERLILKNTAEDTITSFKAYPMHGGDVLYVVEKESIHGYLLGLLAHDLFLWDHESFYAYDNKEQKLVPKEKLQVNKVLVDIAVINEKFVYFYENVIESKEYRFLVKNLMEVFIGYKYDQFHDYCGDPLCHFMCVPDTDLKKTRCLCPDDALMVNEICQCSPESPNCFSCKNHEFSCGDGTCIPDMQVCDGINDCYDGKDEVSCVIKCNSETFKCTPLNKCLDISMKCNRTEDCPDGSDERGCIYSTLCKPDEFTCDNSKCIPKNKVCNNVNDCGDHSDESKCHDRKCTKREFECLSDKTCVPISAVCDDNFDCADMSDETNCHSLNQPLNPDCPFSCDDKCIALEKVCDHYTDCNDNTDEYFCNYKTKCSEGYLPCKFSDYCYKITEACNGIYDCRDGTDEKNCPKGSYCKNPTAFRCVNNPMECVPNNVVCNGYFDCKDGSDEMDCGIKSIRYVMYKNGATSSNEPYVELSWLVIQPPSNSSFSVQLLNSNFHKVAYIITKKDKHIFTNLNMCETYIAIVGYEDHKNTKVGHNLTQTFKVLGSSISKTPQLEWFNQTFISWSNFGEECKYNSFYVECKKKNVVKLKSFITNLNITIPAGLDSCNVYSCIYPVYNILCSEPILVYPYSAKIRRIQIVTALILTTILVVTLSIFLSYRFRSPLRRIMVSAFYKQYIPNQTYECINDNFETSMDSESDTFIN